VRSLSATPCCPLPLTRLPLPAARRPQDDSKNQQRVSHATSTWKVRDFEEGPAGAAALAAAAAAQQQRAASGGAVAHPELK